MADDHPTTDPGEDEYGKVEGGEDEDDNANPQPPPATNASPSTRVDSEEFARANDDD
jgi:hypothetical protein